MIPKIKKIKHYKGPIYRATQELRDITRQLEKDDLEECMKIFNLRCQRFPPLGGGDCTDLELVDIVCKMKGSQVKSFSCACLMPAKAGLFVAEATNDQLLDLFSRLDNLKVFL
jgi:hypothetical protein